MYGRYALGARKTNDDDTKKPFTAAAAADDFSEDEKTIWINNWYRISFEPSKCAREKRKIQLENLCSHFALGMQRANAAIEYARNCNYVFVDALITRRFCHKQQTGNRHQKSANTRTSSTY